MTAEARFPAESASDAARVTFVLVTYGGGELVLHCLEMLAKHTPEPHRVIVVDSASPDGTGEWLERNLSADVTVLRMAENLGFGTGCNLGISRADTEFVCLLNADVEVTEGWLPPLLARLDDDPALAAVAPVMLWPDGRVQEAGSLLGSDGFSRGWADGAEDVTELYPRPVDYASAACLVLRRKAFHAVGGFSPEYHIAYYEDTDLQFALRDRAVGQVWVEPTVRVRHVRHGTSTTDTAERLSAINREVFLRRWAHQLTARPPSAGAEAHPHRIFWLRDAIAAFSALVVVGELPGEGRAYQLITALRAADPAASVTVLAPAGTEPIARKLRAAGIEVSIVDGSIAGEWSWSRAGLYDLLVTVGTGAVPLAGAVTDGQCGIPFRVFDPLGLPHREIEDAFVRTDVDDRTGLAGQAAHTRALTRAGARDADLILHEDPAVADWLSTQIADGRYVSEKDTDLAVRRVLAEAGLAPPARPA